MSIYPEVKTALKAAPFVKWAGGKQALMPVLIQHFPRKFTQFFDPFVGGGSVAFATGHKRTVICDANEWLIDTYKSIRDDWKRVATLLDGVVNTKPEYLRIRTIDPATLDRFSRAAHFIYLNKACFRGLYRVNQKGQFNVPYGAYQRRYYDPDNLAKCAAMLQVFTIRHGDFESGLNGAGRGDFAYMDPPYFKLGGCSDFNRYTPGQFREADHVRLAAVCRDLDARGVQWAVSNSNTSLVRSLFDGYNVVELKARREINLTSSNRAISELLITNYEVPRSSPEQQSSVQPTNKAGLVYS